MSLINENRLRNYPRIIAVVFTAVYGINALFRQGWNGGIGGLISFDFLTFYAIGRIYWSDIDKLYDVLNLFSVEQEIFLPTSLGGGGNIFSYPPYVALASSLFTLIPYNWAYYFWTLSSITFIALAVFLLSRYLVHPELIKDGLSYFQLLIISVSFFPVVWGLNLGQNHGLTLLLITGIIVFSFQEKWILAGISAGILSYKPHFALGFLIIWLVWRKYRALASFSFVAAIWFLSVIFTSGFEPYRSYINALPMLVELPYGVGRFLELSLFALIATILPRSAFAGYIIV